MREEKENKEIKNNTGKEYANSKIPAAAKKSLWTMLVVMLGYGLFPSTINTGAMVASSFDFGIFLLIILAGNLILTIYALLLSLIAIENDVSLHNLSRRVFGSRGYAVTSTILIISQIGWFGVGIMLVSQSLVNILGIDASTIAGFLMLMITLIMGVLITSSAFFGVKALEIASKIAIPTVLGLGLLMCAMSLMGGSWGEFDTGKPHGNLNGEITWYFAIGLVVSTFISGATLIPDFIRWAKKKSHAIIVVFFTFLVLQSILLFFGAFAYYGIDTPLFGDYDNSITLYSALSIMGLTTVGFIALFANVWTSNDNSLYSSGLATSNIFGIKKTTAVILLGTIGTLLAPIFNTSGFVWFLNALGYLVPGIGTMLIVDYYVFFRWFNILYTDEYFKFKHEYRAYKWEALASWIIGIILTMLFQIILPFIVPLYIMFFTGIVYIILKYVYQVFFRDPNRAVNEHSEAWKEYEEEQKENE